MYITYLHTLYMTYDAGSFSSLIVLTYLTFYEIILIITNDHTIENDFTTEI